jgi:hypothetical protein
LQVDNYEVDFVLDSLHFLFAAETASPAVVGEDCVLQEFEEFGKLRKFGHGWPFMDGGGDMETG